VRPIARSSLQGLAFSLPFVVALAVRLVGVGEVVEGPVTRLVDSGHVEAWRMVAALESFPAPPPSTDAMFNHPHGAAIGPPGLAYLGGALAWLGGLSADGGQVARLGTLLVAFLGALAVLGAALLARRYVSTPWAVLAGLLLALWPMHVELGRVGRVDPLVLAPLSVLVVLILHLRERWVASGAVLGASVWLWPAALLPVGLLGLVMALHAILEPPRRRKVAGSLALALVLTLPLFLAPWSALQGLFPDDLRELREGWRALHELRPGEILLSLTLLALVLPALLALALSAPLPDPRRREVGLLALLSGALLVLGSLQIKLLPLALALAAPLAALGLSAGSRRLASLLVGRARPTYRRALAPSIGVAALCLHWPGADYLFGARERGLSSPGGPGVEEAALRIRAGIGLTARRPALLAPLDVSGVMVNLARVPVVGAAMDPASPGNRDTLSFRVAQDPRQAREVLARRRVGAVLVTQLKVNDYARELRRLGRPDSRLWVARSARRAMALHLHIDLGSGKEFTGSFLPAVHWLQHIWESCPRPTEPQTHLYRVVEGARLRGRGPPRAIIDLKLRLITARGRPFTYHDRLRSDSAGRFQFRVPYFTTRAVPAEVRRYLRALQRLRAAMARRERGLKPLKPLSRPAFCPLGPVVLTVKEQRLEVDVSKQAVLAGGIVVVDFGDSADATPIH
jgi:4-amino-4-deoxy-L-arabinose transferase-like glycosyltransferase